jgi:hypothetical protein
MRYLTMISLIFLSACASYEESFDCEVGRGVGCLSLSSVNALVDQGKLPLEKPGVQDTEAKTQTDPQNGGSPC